MRMRRVTLLAIMVVVSALVLANIAEAADNQVGTWKLNVAKSKFSPGPAPKDATLTIESQADGVKLTNHVIDAEGKTVHKELSPKYDGKDYPMTGNPDADMISLKKIDDNTIETVPQEGRQIHDHSPRRGLQRWQGAHGYVQRDERQRREGEQHARL